MREFTYIYIYIYIIIICEICGHRYVSGLCASVNVECACQSQTAWLSQAPKNVHQRSEHYISNRILVQWKTHKQFTTARNTMVHNNNTQAHTDCSQCWGRADHRNRTHVTAHDDKGRGAVKDCYRHMPIIHVVFTTIRASCPVLSKARTAQRQSGWRGLAPLFKS